MPALRRVNNAQQIANRVQQTVKKKLDKNIVCGSVQCAQKPVPHVQRLVEKGMRQPLRQPLKSVLKPAKPAQRNATNIQIWHVVKNAPLPVANVLRCVEVLPRKLEASDYVLPQCSTCGRT